MPHITDNMISLNDYVKDKRVAVSELRHFVENSRHITDEFRTPEHLIVIKGTTYYNITVFCSEQVLEFYKKYAQDQIAMCMYGKFSD